MGEMKRIVIVEKEKQYSELQDVDRKDILVSDMAIPK